LEGGTTEVVVVPRDKEPDVFETEDLIEDSQKENVDYITEVPNENIEKERLPAKESFSKFSDKNFDTSAQNYSDSLVKKRLKRGGFLANQTEFELQPIMPKEESFSQRFHRLQYEVKNFLQDVEQKKLEKSEEAAKQAEPEVDPSNVAEELSQLQKLLQKTFEDEKLQAIINPKIEMEMAANIQEGLSKKLLVQLSNYLNKSPQQNQDNKDSLVYELYYKPDQMKQIQNIKLADLDRRLTELEQLVGPKISEVPLNLLSTVAELREKLVLLSTPKQLEVVQHSVNSISQDLDKLVEKKLQQEELEKNSYETKVNEIFETMERWDLISQQLPNIVSRLQALKSLHNDGASFQQGVQQLEAQQEEIKKLLKFNGELMTKVDANFKGNLNIIQSNFQAMETRFSDLTKKLEDLGMETF